MSNHLDPALQLSRAQTLDELARLDGRGDPSHPLAGTFTGLGRPFSRLLTVEAELLGLKLQLAAVCDRLAQLERPSAPGDDTPTDTSPE